MRGRISITVRPFSDDLAVAAAAACSSTKKRARVENIVTNISDKLMSHDGDRHALMNEDDADDADEVNEAASEASDDDVADLTTTGVRWSCAKVSFPRCPFSGYLRFY